MKRTIKNLAVIFMMVIVFCFVAVQASAADASALSFTACDGGVMVSSCNKTASGKLEIPSEYNGSKVVKIGDNAFNNCTSLTSVVIPEGVKVIGNSAFEGCSKLADIKLPESLTTISSYAFFGCDALKTVVLYPNTKTIGEFAFYDCAGLESIAIPEGTAKIAAGTFGECVSLKNIYEENIIYYQRSGRRRSRTGRICVGFAISGCRVLCVAVIKREIRERISTQRKSINTYCCGGLQSI